ncbi:ketopantoate reductase family protein, partial [bacterium]|nr:ketopantoate reductase family protein [bacterium]
MEPLNHIYLCGLGALGGMYASRFCAAPVENFQVIADPERIRRYREEGVTVNGSRLPLSYLPPGKSAPVADLVVISVKWHQLNQAIAQVRSFVGEQTIILSLLNGIDSEDVIHRELGIQPLYSFVVETDVGREEQYIEYRTLGTIVFGEKENSTISPRVEAVRELFERVGIPYRIPEDMLRELWWKFMLNVGVNPTSAIMKAPYGTFQN